MSQAGRPSRTIGGHSDLGTAGGILQLNCPRLQADWVFDNYNFHVSDHARRSQARAEGYGTRSARYLRSSTHNAYAARVIQHGSASWKVEMAVVNSLRRARLMLSVSLASCW